MLPVQTPQYADTPSRRSRRYSHWCWRQRVSGASPRQQDNVPHTPFPRHQYFMRLALREAERAATHDDVPIGAVIVRDDEVLAASGNERELRRDPVAHAEILAIQEAARRLGGWRLLDTVMYVTLEPCPMCAGAIVQARIPHLVFGAQDDKAGAAGSLYNLVQDPRLNHKLEVTAGVLEDECLDVLKEFFARKR
jgi:tRNA(adenine34) deaminase